MVKRILNLNIIFKIGYWIFISICVMGPANYAVVACYNCAKKLNEQNL